MNGLDVCVCQRQMGNTHDVSVSVIRVFFDIIPDLAVQLFLIAAVKHFPNCIEFHNGRVVLQQFSTWMVFGTVGTVRDGEGHMMVMRLMFDNTGQSCSLCYTVAGKIGCSTGYC